MRTQKFTVTQSELNTGNEKEIDILLTEGNEILRASEVLIQNDSNVELGYISIEDDTEKANRTAYPSSYTFIPIPIGESELSITTPQYLYIKKLSTNSASGDIDIYCLNYKNL